MKIVLVLVMSMFVLGNAMFATRIVSMSPVMTEILYAIGAGDDVVGVTTWCNYPPQVKTLPNIGDYQPQVEAILLQKPDLVLGVGNSAAVVKQLQRMGVDTDSYESPHSIEALYDLMLKVGARVNREKAAAQLVARLKQEAGAMRRTRPEVRPSVLLVIWYPPLMSVGPETFMDDMLTLAGGENIVTASVMEFPKLNVEWVVQQDPDVIVMTHQALSKSLSRDSFVALTTAGKEGRVVTVNADVVSRAGPRFLEGVRELREVIRNPLPRQGVGSGFD